MSMTGSVTAITRDDAAGRQDPRIRRTARALSFWFVVAQVLLILVVMDEVDMLPLAFRRVMYLAAAGFVVHHFLPMRFRLPFFSLLSLAAIFLVLGTSTTPDRSWDYSAAALRGGALIAIGLALIGICHVPVGFWWRAALLVAAGAVVAAFRTEIFGSGSVMLIWPVLAGMFMFRLIVYLHDLSTSKERPSAWRSIAYFFMLPNACVTLFPVVDFKTMFRSHYNEAALLTYQRGVRWISRGVIQLLLYRYVDQVFAKSAANVESGFDLVRFIIGNSCLYLNVSGSFHIIVGMLLLFGFNLPTTNRSYFLASSFTDYWRRTNIYWKDFMMKTFYYPMYFRLKHRGATQALIAATLWVFFATWALHLYQTWWLRASAEVTLPDVLFWSILGTLVLVNSLWEIKRARPRRLAVDRYPVGTRVALSLQTAATFASISILWSLWSSPSISAWLGLWQFADRNALIAAAGVLAVVAAAKFVLEARPDLEASPVAVGAGRPNTRAVPHALLRSVVPLLFVYFVAQPTVEARIAWPQIAQLHPSVSVQRLLDPLKAGDSFPPGFNEELNYYERLGGVDEGNRQLTEVLYGTRIAPRLTDFHPTTGTRDFRQFELIPNFKGAAFQTDEFQTNSSGFRDRSYTETKRADTIRIAVLGASHAMGWGVRQHEVFETIVEDRLNQSPPTGIDRTRFEILNFAVFSYSPLSQIDVLQKQVQAFGPDVVILVSHETDFAFLNNSLRRTLQRGNAIPYDFLREMLRRANLYESLHDGLARQRLEPFEHSLAAWSLKQVVEQSRSMGALPIYAFIPVPTDLPMSSARLADAALLKGYAAEAGFEVFDLSSVFNGYPIEEITDVKTEHSNARAHALLADQLYRDLKELLQTERRPPSSR